VIKVTNASGSDHQDRYNGVDYKFPYGESVIIPDDAAIHMFGMGQQDKLRQITRLGWAPTGVEMDGALKRLDSFMLEPYDDEEDEEQDVAVHISRPTEIPSTQEGLNGAKSRTKTAFRNAG